MYNKQAKILLEALPILSKVTGGYSTLTDSNGKMITNYDYKGEELSQYKGQVYNMAVRCIKEERPLIGPAHYDPNCTAWAIPIGDYVLVSTDTQRIRSEENLKVAITNALPHIGKIVGGVVTICDKNGNHVFSCDSNGEPIVLDKPNELARKAIETMKPIVDISSNIEGVHYVYIPITADCCLILNNETAAIRSNKLLEEVRRLQKTKFNLYDIIGDSSAIQQTKLEAKKTAKSNSTVMLIGETGTGKEMFAQSIHNASHREGKPFIAINCAALPQSLIESHLFGYEGGSFTGAKKGGMAGSFEQADGGTIFLDEISELDYNSQGKILRVLQEKEVTRVGSNTAIPVDVRVICATNKNLFEMVRKKEFREDLYYRLNVIRINLPPLRKRQGDVALLVEHFIKKYNLQVGRTLRGIDDEALQALEIYSWPGNVRELENSIEYAVNMTDYSEELVKLMHLPHHISLQIEVNKSVTDNLFDTNNKVLKDFVEEYEKEIIMKSMKKFEDNTKVVAEHLGLSITTLWRKMKRYDMI